MIARQQVLSNANSKKIWIYEKLESQVLIVAARNDKRSDPQSGKIWAHIK